MLYKIIRKNFDHVYVAHRNRANRLLQTVRRQAPSCVINGKVCNVLFHLTPADSERVDCTRSALPNSIGSRQRQDWNFPLGLVLIIGEQWQQLGRCIE
jgi:hypothetical protein